jgi:hypothetical protein
LLGRDFVDLNGQVFRRLGTEWTVDLNDIDQIFQEFGAAGEGSYNVEFAAFQTTIRKINVEPSWLSKTGRGFVSNALPFGVDAGFQLWQDWGNPRLPFGRKIGRAVISGGVGVVGGASLV